MSKDNEGKAPVITIETIKKWMAENNENGKIVADYIAQAQRDADHDFYTSGKQERIEKIDYILRSAVITIGLDIDSAKTGQMWAFDSERLATQLYNELFGGE